MVVFTLKNGCIHSFSNGVRFYTFVKSIIDNSSASGSVSVYNRLVSLIGISKFHFLVLEAKAIWLVLGLVSFMNTYLTMHQEIGITDHFFSGQKLHSSNLWMIQLKHLRCGGATLFKILLTFHWWVPLFLQELPFCCKITDIIDYGQRSGPLVEAKEIPLMPLNVHLCFQLVNPPITSIFGYLKQSVFYTALWHYSNWVPYGAFCEISSQNERLDPTYLHCQYIFVTLFCLAYYNNYCQLR